MEGELAVIKSGDDTSKVAEKQMTVVKNTNARSTNKKVVTMMSSASIKTIKKEQEKDVGPAVTEHKKAKDDMTMAEQRGPVVTVRRPVNGRVLSGKTTANPSFTNATTITTITTTKSGGSEPTDKSTSTAGLRKPPPSYSQDLTSLSSASTSFKSTTNNGGFPCTIDMSRRPLKKRLTPPPPRNLFGPNPPTMWTPQGASFTAADDNYHHHHHQNSSKSSTTKSSSSLSVVGTPYSFRGDRRSAASAFSSTDNALPPSSVTSSSSTGSNQWYAHLLADPLLQTPQSLEPFMVASTFSERRTVSMNAAFPHPSTGLLDQSTSMSLSQMTPVNNLIGSLQGLCQENEGRVALMGSHYMNSTNRFSHHPTATTVEKEGKKMTKTMTESPEILSTKPNDKYSMWLARFATSSPPTASDSRASSSSLMIPFDQNATGNTLTRPDGHRLPNSGLVLPGYSQSNMAYSFTPIVKRGKVRERRESQGMDLSTEQVEEDKGKSTTTPADIASSNKKKITIKITIPRALSGNSFVDHPHLFFDVPVTDRQCKCGGSKCLKLYCECFHSGKFCDPGFCRCRQCQNTEEYNSTKNPRGPRVVAIMALLSKKPRAFTGGRKANTTGCRCKKSG